MDFKSLIFFICFTLLIKNLQCEIKEIEFPSYQTENFIISENFESVDKFEQLTNWKRTESPSKVEIDTNVSYSGRKSLKINIESPIDFNFYHIYSKIKVEPSTEYTFLAYVRTEFESGDIGFEIVDARGYHIFCKMSEKLSGKNDWTPLYIYFITPKDANEMYIRVRHLGSDKSEKPLKGILWIDDFKVIKGKIEIKEDVREIETEITINEKEIVRKVNKNLLGIDYDPVTIRPVLLEPGTTDIRKDYLLLFKDYPLNLVKWAGGPANWYQWKRSIGDINERKPQEIPGRLWDKQVELGIVEFIKSVKLINPKAKFMWVVNIMTDKPEDNADLVEFLKGDKRTKWGKRRIELGIKEPVEVIAYELGAELDTTLTLDEYIKRCKETIKEIRKIDQNAKFIAFAGTAPHDPEWDKKRTCGKWENWHRKVIEELKDDISYITFHFYYGPPLSDMEKYINIITNDIKKITGEEKIKICIGEHGVWPGWEDRTKPWSTYWYKTHSLNGCLLTAEAIIRMLNRKDVEIANYHNFSSGPWGLVYLDKEKNNLYTTGIYDLFKLLDETFENGEYVLKTDVKGDFTDIKEPSCNFVSTSLNTTDGLILILINRSPKLKRKISFKSQWNNSYRLKKEIIFSGEKLDSYNKPDKKEIFVKTNEYKNGKIFNSYSLEPKTLAILYLEKDREISEIPKGIFCTTNTCDWVIVDGKRKSLFEFPVEGVSNYIGWKSIEKEKGSYTWPGFSRMLEDAKKADKKLAYHILAGIHTPDWVFEKVEPYYYSYPDGRKVRTYLPWKEKDGKRVLNTEILEIWEATVKEFSKFIHSQKDKDRIFFVFITGWPFGNGLELSVGFSNYQEFKDLKWDIEAEDLYIKYCKKVVDIFIDAFPDIPLGIAFTDYYGVNPDGTHRRSYRESEEIVSYALKKGKEKNVKVMPMGLFMAHKGIVYDEKHPLNLLMNKFKENAFTIAFEGPMGSYTGGYAPLKDQLDYAIKMGASWVLLWHHDVIYPEYQEIIKTYNEKLKEVKRGERK